MTSASSLGDDDIDPLKEARAYNDSILFMVTVPYVLLGGCIVLVWWGLRRTAQAQAAATSVHTPAQLPA